MAVQIQLRRGTASAWTAANPTLAIGEFAVETDTDKYKIGDGSTAWTSLGYSSLPSNAIASTGGTFTGAVTFDGASPIVFEGATADAHETTITITDPTADRTITIPNETGTVVTTAGGTFTGAVTIPDLTVTGTTTTVSSTNTVVADSLFELNNGASSNANDLGIVMERGSTGDNAIIAWDESADKFTMGTTTATGASTGDLTITAGTLVVNVEGAVTGNASTATALATARTIGGVSFDGTANITLPGVNASGTQDTSGNATTATTAGTVTTAAQSAITSVGTMTGLAVDGTSQLYECVTEAISGNKTPALTDAGKVFYCSQSGGTQTITIDGSISWPVGTQMVFVASNTSTVTFAESNSTSLDSKDDNKSIDGRYASAALINYGSNTWFLIGALA